jgi:hypothetical protein
MTRVARAEHDDGRYLSVRTIAVSVNVVSVVKWSACHPSGRAAQQGMTGGLWVSSDSRSERMLHQKEP